MFEGFETHRVQTSGAEINLVRAGEGPPLLLLHGYPQTHVMWHKIAPRLAQEFTVVAPDLRGYGDSAKPAGDAEHIVYSKRSMAQDQVEVMQHLGYEQFMVVGHDRGARVGHRMALDHPQRVQKLAVLDIAPTLYVFQQTNQALATAYFHWFFLIQPAPFPETLIGNSAQYYFRSRLEHWGQGLDNFSPESLAEYERCFCQTEAIHASCEDYRAAASIDLVHDAADRERRVECPLLALWGTNGFVGQNYNVLGVWREYAMNVDGAGLPCGHFLAEERPDETYTALRAFLRQS